MIKSPNEVRLLFIGKISFENDLNSKYLMLQKNDNQLHQHV